MTLALPTNATQLALEFAFVKCDSAARVIGSTLNSLNPKPESQNPEYIYIYIYIYIGGDWPEVSPRKQVHDRGAPGLVPARLAVPGQR